MAVIGNTSEPTANQEWTGLNTLNQQALLVTMPEDGEFTRLGGWFAGKDSSAVFRLCLWSAGGTLLRQSSSFTAAGRSFGLSQNDNYERDITPYAFSAGQKFYIGWSRDPSDSGQWGYTSSGSHLDDTQTGSWPGSLSGFQSHSGQIGAYAYYETNQAPNAPTLTSPSSGAILTDTTPTLQFKHSDPDGDSANAFQVQVDNNSNFSSPTYDSGTVSTSTVNGGTISHTTPTLSRGVTYYWRARTRDVNGVWGAWCGSRTFKINSLPTASLSSPASGAIITDTTPALKFTYSDGDGDSMSQYEIEVDNNSDFSSPVIDQTVTASASSGSTVTYTVGSALSRGITYYWRVRVKDSRGEWGSFSASRTFKVNQLPTVSVLAPAASGLAEIHNLAETTEWTSGGAHAKPKYEWSYSDADGHGQSAYQVQLSDDAGATVLADTGEVSSANKYHLAATGLVNGVEYHWRVRVKDSLGEWSSYTAWSPFKVRWGQAIYEYPVAGGANSAAWQWSNASTPSGTSSVFLFATATGAGGAGRSAWHTSIGSLAPADYLNVLVRLSTKTVGTSASIADMTFTYKASAIQPDRWVMEPATTDWLLDGDVRRFGTQSLRCLVSTTSGNRYIYPYRKTPGDDVIIQPNTDYTLSAFVKTGSPLATGAALRLALYPAGSLSGELTDWYTDTSEQSTTDTAGHPEGWQRLVLRFRSGTGATLLRPMVHYIHNGTTAGDQFWVDAVKLEEGHVATAWTPGFVGDPVVLDANGIAVDGSAGGIFRLRGSDGGARDIVDLGSKGLVFGGDAPIESPAQGLIMLPSSSDATLADETGVLQIGPSGGANLGLDGNEIVARSGGSASTLHLQTDGGAVRVGQNAAGSLLEVGNYPNLNSSRLGEGLLELRGSTPYIDFANDNAIDYDMRLRLTGNDVLNVEGGELQVGGKKVITAGAGWVKVGQQNIVNGSTYSTITEITTGEVTAVPANVTAITGRVYVSSSAGIGGKAAIVHYSDGGQAGQAEVATTAVEDTSLFIAEPGGTNGRQLKVQIRPDAGEALTLYVQVTGYIP